MKICTKCKEEKDLVLFHFRNKDRNERSSQCSDCFNAYRKSLYKNNKNYYFKLAKEARERKVTLKKEYALNYLKNNPCVDCGEKDVVVLDFDHVKGVKLKGVAQILHDGHSLSFLKEEINKCEIRCANCHRRKTAKQAGYYRFGAN